MKFRLISKNCDAIALLYKIEQEGHSVDFWTKDKRAKNSYEGMLSQISDWKPSLTKDKIVIIDTVGLGSIADKLKKTGHKVCGGGKLNDRLELDRQFGMKIAKVSGLKVPVSETFDSFDKAIDFVAQNNKVWVFKPQNNKSPAYTYISSDSEDMVEMLDYFSDIWEGKPDFVLQEKIEGVELSTEMFYIDGEPLRNTLNSTLEAKRFMEGDKGQMTGCMGSVVRFWKKSDPKIYRLTLKKLEPFLKRFKYSGPLDINCIISEKDNLPYFLEFTSRFGYNAIYALCEGLNQNVGNFIASLASGQPEANQKPLRPSYDWLGAVRVSVPPYPNDKGVELSAERPIRGIDNHVWLLDAKKDKNENLVTAGVDGVVCEVSGKDKSIDGLFASIYSRISKLKIPDKQYRSDLGDVTNRKLTRLKELRYF